jgi:hypothetical protein
MSSLLTQGAHDRELGRRQGMSTTANTAALALSAAISGPLFNVSPSTPFTVFALMTALCASTLVFWWRQVEGRVSAPRN